MTVVAHAVLALLLWEQQAAEKYGRTCGDAYSPWNSAGATRCVCTSLRASRRWGLGRADAPTSRRFNTRAQRTVNLEDGNHTVCVKVEYGDGGYSFAVDDAAPVEVAGRFTEAHRLTSNIEGARHKSTVALVDGTVHVFTDVRCCAQCGEGRVLPLVKYLTPGDDRRLDCTSLGYSCRRSSQREKRPTPSST